MISLKEYIKSGKLISEGNVEYPDMIKTKYQLFDNIKSYSFG